MPLIQTSKEAKYGDDMQALTKETMQLVERIKNNVIAFQTLITSVQEDTDMTQVEVDEITVALNKGYTYIWNQMKTVVPVAKQV